MSPKLPVWLITGCSAGFGLSLTRIVLKSGLSVIATSRKPSKNPDLVQEVESLGGIWLQLDVTGSPENLQAVVAKGKEKFGRIDVLVNVAGVAIIGPLEDFNNDEKRLLMDTNFLGPLNLIQAILPSMREQKSGTIVNISSAAGVDPRPGMSMYGATKFALEGMSQGLAKEVAPFGIRVLIISPGAFQTSMAGATAVTAKPLTAAYEGTTVGEWWNMFQKENGSKVFNDLAPNNVEKGCQAIFEVVSGTGRGEGKEGFGRFPLSEDCAGRTLEQAERLKEAYKIFENIWSSTKA